MKKIILNIEGMTCSACSNGLEKYLNKQKGVINASVNLVLANVSITYDEKELNVNDLELFVKKAGFKSLGVFKEIKIENVRKKEKIEFVFYTILAVILMYVAMYHMVGLPFLNIIDVNNNPLNYSILLLVLSLLFIYYGKDILKSGYINLVHKVPNMDTLVSLGSLSSFLFSLYSMVKLINGDNSMVHHLYFESVAMILYFVKLGRYIDNVSKDKTKEAISKLVSITPSKAYLKENDKIKEITIDEVKKNDILVCRPGDSVAVDGVIISGRSHLDEAFITGESKPVLKNIDDKVLAGSLNYDGYIEYRALNIGKDSTISQIINLVVEATNNKVPIASLADKIASIFVPSVILLALVTMMVYLFLGKDFESSLKVFTTILVVACPCSLGLATPLAVVVCQGICANEGILIRNSKVLEILNKLDIIAFDKTGTLTYGEPKIAKIFNYSLNTDEDIIKLIGSLEKNSAHPLSKAFTNYMAENKISSLDVKNFSNIDGMGIKGMINNQEILVGSNKLLKKYKINNSYLDSEEALQNMGCSIVYLVVDKKITALVGVNDIIRDGSKKVIQELKNMNITPIMLTGDNKNTALKIAKSLGITEINADVLPNDKSNIISKLKSQGKIVMMCGDGINDSPSLVTADVGLSVGSASDIAKNTCDVILIRNDLEKIVDLLKISHNTMKIIKQNLFWAFFYNALMIPLAMGIFRIKISPMFASMAMILSSLTVILNTLRLKRKYK